MNKNIFHGALLESILLNFINDASDEGLHGYGLLKMIQQKYGVRLGSSSLYPELNCLEKRGLIESKWEVGMKRACKQYRITRTG